MKYIGSSGPHDARIALVGEAPGGDEERDGLPFVGVAGHCLDTMLHEAGLARSECFVTNVCRHRPEGNDISRFISPRPLPGFVPHNGAFVQPFVLEHLQHLQAELEAVRPNIVVALGNIPLWALVGHNKLEGIGSWRGYLTEGRFHPKVLVTYHPSYILRTWSDRADVVQDFRRVKRESATSNLFKPSYIFHTRPSFYTAISKLETLWKQVQKEPTRLSLDIETRKRHIACMGLAWSRTEALCIPFNVYPLFLDIKNPEDYWMEAEEITLVRMLYRIMSHPNCLAVGQNLHYDSQYWARYWGVVPHVHLDTSVAHHLCFPDQAKALDYLVPRYCEHPRRWKADGKEWHVKQMSEDVLWRYNCLDCVYTYEISEVLETVVDKMGLRPQFEFQQHRLWRRTLEMMLRGVRFDRAKRAVVSKELERAIDVKKTFIEKVAGHPLNTNSHAQMKKFFYNDLGITPIHNRKTDTITVNDEALERIAKREPLTKPLVEAIQDSRTYRIFKSTFVDATLDSDGRMRCSYNQCGTRTFRFSSSESAFYTGTNLQNLPRTPKENGLPNVRSLFIPDEGYVLMDWDLERADLQVVAWEANDELLKQQLREGTDLHEFHAKELRTDRYRAKVWVHGTNYGGRPRTMAAECGITVHEAERLRNRYFVLRPGILDWHHRIESQLKSTQTVENKFGYRIRFFDRPDNLLSEGLAWIPQSTVGIVINMGFVNICETLPYVEILLQTHDSLTMQVPESYYPACIPAIRQQLLVTVPYPDPLVIPVDGKFSRHSFGELEAILEEAK